MHPDVPVCVDAVVIILSGADSPGRFQRHVLPGSQTSVIVNQAFSRNEMDVPVGDQHYFMRVIPVDNIAIRFQRNVTGSFVFTVGPNTVEHGNASIGIQIFHGKIIAYQQHLLR